jgi:hypothetical protein
MTDNDNNKIIEAEVVKSTVDAVVPLVNGNIDRRRKEYGLRQVTKKLGQPSKYKPRYCKEIVQYFDVDPIIYKDITVADKNGNSIEKTVEESVQIPMIYKFAKHIGISMPTMYEWCEKYPEFKEAYEMAKQMQLNVLVQNALRGNYNAFFSFQMAKNMFGWRDKVEQEITGANGGAIKTANLNFDIKGASSDDLVRYLQEEATNKG